MMKLKINNNQRSLFHQNNQKKSIININRINNPEQTTSKNHLNNEDSLIILLKEENNVSTSNIINKLILNVEDNPLITKNKSLNKDRRKSVLSLIDINKRRQSETYNHQQNGENILAVNNFSHFTTREKHRSLTRMDQICDSSQEEESDLDEEAGRFTVIPFNNNYKQIWDYFFIVYVIILTIFIPFIVSFTANTAYIVVIGSVNFLVMTTEIVLQFMTSYIDDKDNIIENPKLIMILYLKSWFFIDIITWFPYSLCALEPSYYPNLEYNLRFDQDIALLQKLLTLIPLIQMLKILMKGQLHSILKIFSDLLRINSQIERLIYFLFSFVLMNHVVACLWFFTSNLQYFNPNCWVVKLGYIDKTIGELYLACYSWSLATITTIGFGNISAGTSIERLYNLIVMSFGVVMFSFAIGSLSSIVNISDRKAEKMTQKLQMLSLIQKEYKINKEISQRIRASIKYDHNQNNLSDNNNFLQDLPSRLGMELTKIMIDSKIKEMSFFIQYPSLFAHIAPFLKSVQFIQRDVLYKPNDKIQEMYFISAGTVSFCLGQEYNEKEIKMIKKHNNFGEIEMCIGEVLGYNIKIKSRACRLFLLKKIEFLKLSIRFQETIEEFMQKSLIIHIRFKEKMKTMINKFHSKDDNCNNVNDNSFSLHDKNDLLKDKELECINEKNEEDLIDQESGFENSSCISDDDQKENGGKILNNSSEPSNKDINEEKESHEDIQRLHDKFNNKLNKLIEFITINDIKFSNDNKNTSPLDLLLQIRNSNQSLQDKNTILIKIEKILSESISLL